MCSINTGTFWLFLKNRLTRTVERSLRFLINSALSEKPPASSSSLLLLLLPSWLQLLIAGENDVSSLLKLPIVTVCRDVRRKNSFSREHLLTLGLRFSLSKLE